MHQGFQLFRRYGSVVALLAVGCLTEQRFERAYTEKRCGLLTDCEALDLYGYQTSRECGADLRGAPEECEEFDTDKARKCLDSIDSMDCERLMSTDVPAACESVCSASE